jgi:hypothetical protein
MDAKLAAFKPLVHNPNQHTPRGLAALQASMRRDGFTEPMVAAADGTVLSGNARLESVADIMDAEPIIVESDGTRPVIHVRRDIPNADTASARRIVVASNRVSEIDLSWDWSVLAEQDAETLADLWTPVELSDLSAAWAAEHDEAPAEDPGAQNDKADELQAKWRVVPGDLWQLGAHRLICGDCTDAAVVARVMGGEKAGAVVTDPPYGQNQKGVTNDAPEQLQSIIDGAVANLPIENAVVVAFSSPRTFPTWLDAIRAAGHRFERMLWLYKAAQETFPWRGWLLKSEAILASTVGVGQWQDVHPYSHDCYYKSEVSGELAPDSGWHGSVKPFDVVQDLMSRVSASGAIVFDGFLGSGTTLIACERLGRRCRAVEIEPKYIAVALERWSTMTGQTPIRL